MVDWYRRLDALRNHIGQTIRNHPGLLGQETLDRFPRCAVGALPQDPAQSSEAQLVDELIRIAEQARQLIARAGQRAAQRDQQIRAANRLLGGNVGV